MPPKAKKSSQSLPQSQLTPESSLSISSQSSKIPTNHPHYCRATIYIGNLWQLKRSQILKVKLWKLHSLKLSAWFHDERDRIYNRLVFGTVKKSLSSIKNLKLGGLSRCLGKESFWRLRLRIESFEIENTWFGLEIAKKLAKVIHNGVKKMSFRTSNSYFPEGSQQILLRYCRRLEKLSCTKNFKPHGEKRIELPRLKTVSLIEDRVDFREISMFKHWPKIQDLTLVATYTQLSNFQLPQKALQNLQRIVLHVENQGEIVELDFSPFKMCGNLISLNLDLVKIKLLGLDDLVHFLSLQEFSFRQDRNIPIDLDPQRNSLETLRKLSLASKWQEWWREDQGDFHKEYFFSLLPQVKNLKALELSFSLQRLASLKDLKIDFSLDSLRLEISEVPVPFAAPLQSLMTFLKKQTQLKELDLHLRFGYKGLLEGILKGISPKSPLEKLRVRLGEANELQGRTVPSIKEFIGKFVGLKELSLDLVRFPWDARELSSFVGVFMELKNLEKFELNVTFVKMTTVAFGRFLEFVRSIRHLKKVEMKIFGDIDFSQRKEVERIIGERFLEEI